MDMQSAPKKLIQNKDLDISEMQSVMSVIMEGQVTPAQIGAFLIALQMKGETVDEITGAVDVALTRVFG